MKIEEAKETKNQKFIEDCNNKISTAEIPESAQESTFLGASESSIKFGDEGNKVFIWKNKDRLCFFPSKLVTSNFLSTDDIILKEIPINQIKKFSRGGGVIKLEYVNYDKAALLLFSDINYRIFMDLIPELENDSVPENAREIVFSASSEGSSIHLGKKETIVSIWKKDGNLCLSSAYILGSYRLGVDMGYLKITPLPLEKIFLQQRRNI